MRTSFINTLIELAEKDECIYLLTGDLGFSVFEEFAQRFPTRFINCGIAEQSMMGIAAGLAMSGKRPYVYSIIPFVTLRCLEQIRNDVCYQNLDVKIIGVGSGFAYGSLGATHHATEDLAILRTLPNMTVLAPADPIETKALMLEAYERKGPVYLRLNKGNDQDLYFFSPEIKIGKPSVISNGKDGVIIASGISVLLGAEVAKELEKSGKKFKLISLHTLKPVSKEVLLEEINGAKSLFTIEEHNIMGGLGGTVAEILVEAGWAGKFKRFGIPDQFCKAAGGTEYLRKSFGLAKEKIADEILNLLK